MITHKNKHQKSTIPLTAPKVPQPLPITTEWFIAIKGDEGEDKPFDGRRFANPDDAHKARDELEIKKGTYIHSVNTKIGR